MSASLSLLRAAWGRLENSWISDAIGVALLFGILFVMLSIGGRP
jgi:hypothetical protein